MFKLEAVNCVLKEIKLKQEHHGENFIAAYTLSFSGECEGDMAHILMGGQQDDKPLEFWTEEYGDRVFHGISGTIGSKAEFDECLVKFKGITMKDAKVDKFTFSIESGRKIKVNFKVHIQPSDEQMVKLNRFHTKGSKLTIKTDSLFDPLANEDQEELPI